MEQKDKKIDRDMPRAPLVYHPDTGETEALPGMGTYVGCPNCGAKVVRS